LSTGFRLRVTALSDRTAESLRNGAELVVEAGGDGQKRPREQRRKAAKEQNQSHQRHQQGVEPGNDRHARIISSFHFDLPIFFSSSSSA